MGEYRYGMVAIVFVINAKLYDFILSPIYVTSDYGR